MKNKLAARYENFKEISKFRKRTGRGLAKIYGEFMLFAKSGVADAQYRIAMAYDEYGFYGENPTKQQKWLKLAASKFHPAACNNLAYNYQVGFGVRKNFAKAFEWYRKAAQLGDPVGQYNLALSYEKGDVTKKDLALARVWYQRAALSGHIDAKRRLVKLKARKTSKNR